MCLDPVNLQMWALLRLNIWDDKPVLTIHVAPLFSKALVPTQLSSWSGHTAVRGAPGLSEAYLQSCGFQLQ